jgi:hypothetical protein
VMTAALLALGATLMLGWTLANRPQRKAPAGEPAPVEAPSKAAKKP